MDETSKEESQLVQNNNTKKSFINPEVWQYLISLEDGNPGILNEIIELYLVAAAAAIKDLKITLKKNDYKNLQEKAHSFKSSCNSIGALELATDLDKIELDAKKTAPTVDIELLEKVVKNIGLVTIELESRRNRNSQ